MGRLLRLTAVLFGLACVCAAPTGLALGSRAAPAGVRVRLGAGLSIVVPARWKVAFRLTGLTEPYERFTLASFPLHQPPPARLDCGPNQAIDTMPADGALAFVIEYPPRGASRHDFPTQPKRFVLPPGPADHYDCFRQGWLLRFRVGSRPFQVMIALGPHADRNRVRLLTALGTFRVAAASSSG